MTYIKNRQMAICGLTTSHRTFMLTCISIQKDVGQGVV